VARPVSLLGLEPAMSLQRIFRLRRGDRPSHPISLALAAELDIVRLARSLRRPDILIA
jgi:hypothetical protein